MTNATLKRSGRPYVQISNGKVRNYLAWAGNKRDTVIGDWVKTEYEKSKSAHPTAVFPFCGALGTFFHVRPTATIANDANVILAGLHQHIKYNRSFYPFDKLNSMETFTKVKGRYNAFKPLLLRLVQAVDTNYNELLSTIEPYVGSFGSIYRNCVAMGHDEVMKAIADADEQEPTTDNGRTVDALIAALERQLFGDLLWLNKACLNSLYRENASGGFNVPIGRKADGTPKHPNLPNVEELALYSQILQTVDIYADDFRVLAAMPAVTDKAGSLFWYADPPYKPASDTAKFASYTKDRFTSTDLSELIDLANQRVALGDVFAMSNNYDDDLYARLFDDGFEMHTRVVKRNISAQTKGRVDVKEIAAIKRPS